VCPSLDYIDPPRVLGHALRPLWMHDRYCHARLEKDLSVLERHRVVARHKYQRLIAEALGNRSQQLGVLDAYG
jgi:hypothetical protein